MKRRIVSLVRRPEGLRVCLLVRTPSFGRPPDPSNPKACHNLEDRPLEQARGFGGADSLPDLDRLEQTFRELAEVRYLDAEVARRLLTVLLATVPAPDQPGSLPKLRIPPRPPRPRRTAAHPRGFQGTKRRPPKAALPEPVDLRTALCHRRQASLLARAAWEYRREVLPEVVAGLGSDPARLDPWLELDLPPGDLFTAIWFHGPGQAWTQRESAHAADALTWIAWQAGWTSHRFLLGISRRMGLPADPASGLAVLDLLATEPPRRAEAWLRTTEEQPPENRREFLSAVLGTGACKADPHPTLFRTLSRTADADGCAEQAWQLLAATARGENPAYLEAGLRISAEHRPGSVLRNMRGGEGFEPAPLENAVGRIPVEARSALAMGLWWSAGLVPGLTAHLRELDSWQLPEDGLEMYLRFLADLSWDLHDGPMDPSRWQALRRHLGAVRTLITSIPASHRASAIDSLSIQVDSWQTAEEIELHLPPALQLWERLSRPPFLAERHMVEALLGLDDLPDEDRERVYRAPIEAFRRLDRACRRSNDATLIGWGLGTLARLRPRLVARTFEGETSGLLRVGKLLGSFRPGARSQALGSWDVDPRSESELESLDDAELVAWARNAAGEDAAGIPRALSEYVDGRRPLTSRQVRGHRRRLLGRRDRILLTSLEHHLRGLLGGAVGIARPDSDLLFALRLLSAAGDNRRGLRRFLRAYLAGDARYLATHPATRDWLRRHPAVDAERWTSGLTKHVELPGGDVLALELEREPLEILKLGSHVGTCFGLGGSFSHSAIAVLLDINKQVVYARDPRGSVVARQILAISAEEKLVPFEVYPEAAEEVQRAFRDYDEALAEHLGLPLSRHWKNQIEMVLAQDWWDDGLWPVLEEDEDEDEDPSATLDADPEGGATGD